MTMAQMKSAKGTFAGRAASGLRVDAAVRHATGRNLWKIAYEVDSLQGPALDPSHP